MLNRTVRRCAWAAASALVFAATAQPAHGQVNRRWEPASRLERGTTITVRTSEAISANEADGRVYPGVVEEDVADDTGRVVIPRGSTVELVTRRDSGNELVLDLDSVVVNGQRYALGAAGTSVGTSGSSDTGIGINQRTGEYIGGGAALGAIIGAIAGGGKGAAIGAATGAAAGAGAQILTRGRSVSVPAESLLTFSLQQPMQLGISDTGYLRDGVHYHRYGR